MDAVTGSLNEILYFRRQRDRGIVEKYYSYDATIVNIAEWVLRRA